MHTIRFSLLFAKRFVDAFFQFTHFLAIGNWWRFDRELFCFARVRQYEDSIIGKVKLLAIDGQQEVGRAIIERQFKSTGFRPYLPRVQIGWLNIIASRSARHRIDVTANFPEGRRIIRIFVCFARQSGLQKSIEIEHEVDMVTRINPNRVVVCPLIRGTCPGY